MTKLSKSQSSKKYREEHREQCKERVAKYREDHRDKINETNAAYGRMVRLFYRTWHDKIEDLISKGILTVDEPVVKPPMEPFIAPVFDLEPTPKKLGSVTDEDVDRYLNGTILA
jgi:hypothetical protein